MNDKTMSSLRGKPTDLWSVGVIAAKLLATFQANLTTVDNYARHTCPPSQREPTGDEDDEDEEELNDNYTVPHIWRHVKEDKAKDGLSVETLLE